MISPYAAQVSLLSSTLAAAAASAVEVATVDSFQGREADAVVSSG